MTKRVFLAALALAAAATPRQAEGQALFGAEALFGSDTDFGLGGRVVLDLGTTAPLEFQGGFDLFFPDGPAEYWEINGNVWYQIATRSSDTQPYVGGGLNIGHIDPGGSRFSDTELGINLGGGLKFLASRNTTPVPEASGRDRRIA